MKFYQLEASPREAIGKKAVKALRKEGLVPVVLYGQAPVNLPFNGTLAKGESLIDLDGKKGVVVTNLSVSTDSIRKLFYTPEVYLVDLTIKGGRKTKAIIKAFQTQPVSDEILHIDFLEIFDDKPIEIAVPIALEGHSEGVKAGGKLSLEMRKLRVKGYYKDIPEKLVIDISNLGLGKTIQVGALSFDKLELLNAKNAVVCGVKLTRAARGTAAPAAATAAPAN
ncbi:MAG: 50S ribosomal protein L25 [Tannerella sp.]|jgi:large subunit ribosomal protein L25|nr:50S ribosomal protein L25 [Tannerella sp.]